MKRLKKSGIGPFRVAPILCFKARLRAKVSSTSKLFFIFRQMKFIITGKILPLASFESRSLSIENGIGLFFQTWSSRDCNLSISIHPIASSTGFPKAQWGTRDSPELETSERRKRGMMKTSVDRERGVMGRKRIETTFSLLPITPFVPTFLNN